MNYLTELVRENVYVVAVWDDNWNSYNNCYIVLDDHGVTLVDCGKKRHANELKEALGKLGKTVEDVTTLIATHGHEDHVENAGLFSFAQKWIHPNDRPSIEVEEPEQFNVGLLDAGHLLNFDYVVVGHHTLGSIALYHRPSKVLFAGDFLCFFGDPLSKDGLVSKGDDLRKEWLTFLNSGGVPAEVLGEFLRGLLVMKEFNAEALCTGHGGVLDGDIGQFFDDLLSVGKALQNQ